MALATDPGYLQHQLDEVKRMAKEHIERLRTQLARAEVDKADVITKLNEANEALRMVREHGAGALTELARRGSVDSNSNDAMVAELKRVHAEELEAGKRQYEEYITKLKSHATAQINKLKEDLEAATQSSSITSTVSHLEQENATLVAELEKARQGGSEELRDELNHCREELQEARERIAAAEEENTHIRETASATNESMARLNEQVMRLEADRSMLLGFKEQATAEIEQLTHQLTAARESSSSSSRASNQNNVVLEIEVEKAQAEAQRLQAELDQNAWSHAEALEQARAEMDALRAELDAVTAIANVHENGASPATHSQDEDLRSELEASALHLKGALAKCEELSKELNMAREEMSKIEALASDASVRSKQDMERVASDANAEVAKLKMEMEQLAVQAGEATKLREELDALKEKYSTLNTAAKKEVTRLREELAKSTAANGNNNSNTNKEFKTIPDLEKELASETARANRLTKELAKAEESVARMAEQQASSQSTTDKAAALRQQKLAAAEGRNETLQLEMTRLKQDGDEKMMQMQLVHERLEAGKAEAVQRYTESQSALTAALAEIVTLKKNSAVSSSLLDIPGGHNSGSLFEHNNGNKASSSNQHDAQTRSKTEVSVKEAMDEAKRAKREHAVAKRESIVLADALDKLKLAIKKADMVATGELSLSSDRCADALRTVYEYVDNSLSALDPGGKKQTITAVRSVKLSSSGGGDDPLDASFNRGAANPKTDLDHLVDTLKGLEDRLDYMTETSRVLLPNVKRIAALATLKDSKKNSSSGSCWEAVRSAFNPRSKADRVEPATSTGTGGRRNAAAAGGGGISMADEEDDDDGEPSPRAYSKVRAAVAGGDLDDSTMEETPQRPRPTHAQLQAQQQQQKGE